MQQLASANQNGWNATGFRRLPQRLKEAALSGELAVNASSGGISTGERRCIPNDGRAALPEHRYDGETCHACATRYLGVLY